MKSRFLLALLLLALIAGVWVSPAAAQGGVVFVDHYTLAEGERVDGDLVVFAKTITLEHGSRVTGNAALFAEVVNVRGRIDGELAVLGGDVVLGSGMQVAADVNICGNEVSQADGLRIGGETSLKCDDTGVILRDFASLAFDSSNWQWEQLDLPEFVLNNLGRIDVPAVTPGNQLGFMASMALIAAALNGLVALLFPMRLRRASEAALSAPVATGLIGVLSFVLAGALVGLIGITVLLVVTACLAPVLWLGVVAVGLMTALGWAALSLPVGVWFLSLMDIRRISSLAATSVGTFILTMGTGLLTLNLWTGLIYVLVMFILLSWGLGAVVMTRVGGQAYPRPDRVYAKARAVAEESPL